MREAVPLALVVVVELPEAQTVALPVAVAEDEPLRETLDLVGVALPVAVQDGLPVAVALGLEVPVPDAVAVAEGKAERVALEVKLEVPVPVNEEKAERVALEVSDGAEDGLPVAVALGLEVLLE